MDQSYRLSSAGAFPRIGRFNLSRLLVAARAFLPAFGLVLAAQLWGIGAVPPPPPPGPPSSILDPSTIVFLLVGLALVGFGCRGTFQKR